MRLGACALNTKQCVGISDPSERTPRASGSTHACRLQPQHRFGGTIAGGRPEREGEAGPFSHEGTENVAIERGFLGVQVGEDGLRPIRPGNKRRLHRHPWGHHRGRDACGAWNRKCLLIKLIQGMNPHVFGLFFSVPLERPNE